MEMTVLLNVALLEGSVTGKQSKRKIAQNKQFIFVIKMNHNDCVAKARQLLHRVFEKESASDWRWCLDVTPKV